MKGWNYYELCGQTDSPIIFGGMGGLRVLAGDNGAEILSSGKIPPYSGFIPSGYFPSGFFPSGYFPSGYFP